MGRPDGDWGERADRAVRGRRHRPGHQRRRVDHVAPALGGDVGVARRAASSRARRRTARPALVEAWLRAFGPGTDTDIAWWLGSTLTAVRRALAAMKAVAVDIDGRVGYVMPDDLDDAGPVAPWIALLPPLDPTTMGWKERDWYLGPHKRRRVRHERQRRRDHLVRRPHRRRLAAAGHRRGRGAAARGRRPRGAPGHRRRSRPAHGLAGRRAGAAALPVAALPRAAAARTP